MSYIELKRSYIQGWHTWNVRSVLSHVHMPDGFALNVALKEYREGHYLKETLVGRFVNEYGREPAETAYPGPHAFDESYTEMRLKWCDMEICVESTASGDDLTLLITPVTKRVRPAMLVLEGGFLWGRAGWVEQEGQTLIGHAPCGDRWVHITGTPACDPNIPVQAACLCVTLDVPVAVSTVSGQSLADAQALIAQRRKDHETQCGRFGEMSSMYEAMESALGWDTIYVAKSDRVISPVSRLWSISSGGYVLFCWDNFFAGFMASLGSRELAYSNLREILNEQTPAGFVPNLAYATGQVSADRSQPPVGSAMLLETYRIFREKWIVEDMYDDLLRWNRWFADNRMNASGALCWGSNKIPVLFGNRWETEGVHDTYSAALESGLDNSPMYDDIPFDKATNRLVLEDVGLTGLYILDCRSLIELAHLIGRDADIQELQSRMHFCQRSASHGWESSPMLAAKL